MGRSEPAQSGVESVSYVGVVGRSSSSGVLASTPKAEAKEVPDGGVPAEPAPPGPLPEPVPVAEDPFAGGGASPVSPGDGDVPGDGANLELVDGVPCREDQLDAWGGQPMPSNASSDAFEAAETDGVSAKPSGESPAGVLVPDSGGVGCDVTGGGPKTEPVVCATDPSTESTAPVTGAVTSEIGPSVEPTTGMDPMMWSTAPVTGERVWVTETDPTVEVTVLVTGSTTC